MSEKLPLSALLSQALVAFIVEFDNEFEYHVPHRTTDYGSTLNAPNAPWLVSMAMWMKFLRFVHSEGTPVHELQHLAETDAKTLQLWLTRLSIWWGYVVIEPARISGRLDPSALVRPTRGGKLAIEAWRPLTGMIEQRWRERFGTAEIDALTKALRAITAYLDPQLPGFMPILGYGLYSIERSLLSRKKQTQSTNTLQPSGLTLPELLSKVLFAWAMEFEDRSPVSLAICANLLRLLGKDGVFIRDLPRLSGVSKEAIATSQNFLVKLGIITIEKPAGSRSNQLALTAKGILVKADYHELVRAIEDRWQANYGETAISGLRKSLEHLVGKSAPSPLLRGLEPYPENWRASLPAAEMLPHYPMVLHRGGFPDGS